MEHEPGPVRGDCTVAFRREVALVQTILSALAPIVFTLLLGFVAAWRHDFGPKEASVLNRMVLLYAVPLALFVGTVGTPRTDLVQDIAFVVAIFGAIVGFYVLVFVLFNLIFRFSLSESVLAGLAASSPAVATCSARPAPLLSQSLLLSSISLSSRSPFSVWRWQEHPLR